MKDSTLAKISCSIALIGLVILFLTTRNLPEATLTSLEDQEAGFSAQGTILGSRTAYNKTYITLHLCEDLTGVVKEELNLSEGLSVRIEGELYTWEGEKRVEISKLILE